MKYFYLIFLVPILSCNSKSEIKNFNYGTYSELNNNRLFYKEHKIKEVTGYSYDIPYDSSVTLKMVEQNFPFFKDSLTKYNKNGYQISRYDFYRNSDLRWRDSSVSNFTYNDKGRLVRIGGEKHAEDLKYSSYGNIIKDPEYDFEYGNGTLKIESKEIDMSYSITGIKRPRITIIYIFDDQGRPRFKYSRDYHKFEYYSYSDYEYGDNGKCLKEKFISYSTDDQYVGDKIMRPEIGIKYYEDGRLMKESKEKLGRYRFTKDYVYINGVKRKEIDSNIYFRSKQIGIDFADYLYNTNNELIKIIRYHQELEDTILSDIALFEYKYY